MVVVKTTVFGKNFSNGTVTSRYTRFRSEYFKYFDIIMVQVLMLSFEYCVV